MSSKSADKGGYYILNLILLKNEPQIGRTLIKRGFYVLNLLKNETQIGRRPIKRDIIL
jgi:hypothetical protein